MDADRLAERIEDYLRALGQLEKALAQPKDEFLRDSVIQRFEFTFELGWKMLKLRLEAEGVEVRTPREALQEAFQAGFIEDGNAWSSLMRMRNLSSHTYDESLAEEVYSFLTAQGLSLLLQLGARCRTWHT